jgi:hypothetical protein
MGLYSPRLADDSSPDTLGGAMTVTVGVLATFDVTPGADERVAAFFAEGLPLVERQPGSTVWFAFRTSDTSYGAFAAFANDADRQALLSAGGPQLAQKYHDLFTSRPTFVQVDVLEARLPL